MQDIHRNEVLSDSLQKQTFVHAYKRFSFRYADFALGHREMFERGVPTLRQGGSETPAVAQDENPVCEGGVPVRSVGDILHAASAIAADS
jgi:hypothetical protein